MKMPTRGAWYYSPLQRQQVYSIKGGHCGVHDLLKVYEHGNVPHLASLPRICRSLPPKVCGLNIVHCRCYMVGVLQSVCGILGMASLTAEKGCYVAIFVAIGPYTLALATRKNRGLGIPIMASKRIEQAVGMRLLGQVSITSPLVN